MTEPITVSPITVSYVPRGAEWTVTVQAGDEQRTTRATGILDARDRADEIVEDLVGGGQSPTVVHLLDGDAYAFTTAYLSARHDRVFSGGVLGGAVRAQAAGDAPTGSAAGVEAAEARGRRAR